MPSQNTSSISNHTRDAAAADTLALAPYTPDNTAAAAAAAAVATTVDDTPHVYATAASYRQGTEIPLSNGEWIRLRPRSLNTMVRTKTVPNSLIGAANRMLATAGRTQNPNAPQDPKIGEGQLELQDFLVTQLVASFRVVMEADYNPDDPEQVCVSDLFDADKNLIAQFAVQGQKALEPFRQQ